MAGDMQERNIASCYHCYWRRSRCTPPEF